MSDCKPADASIITSLMTWKRKLPSKDVQRTETKLLYVTLSPNTSTETPSHLYFIKHTTPSKTFQTCSESNCDCVKLAHPLSCQRVRHPGFRNSFCQPSRFYTFLHFWYTSAASGVDFNVSLFVSS